MKEHPILFSTPMVQALLEGRKSQTRRLRGLDKGRNGLEAPNKNPDRWEFNGIYSISTGYSASFVDKNTGLTFFLLKSPYGGPGDALWVKETFYAYGKWVKNGTTKTGRQKYLFKDMTIQMLCDYFYEADSEKPEVIETKKDGLLHWYKRPSLFMPRKAARIFLRVTDIRVERLQDISNEDAITEGINMDETPCVEPMNAYAILWESINGKGSWEKNPWVWVIKFERIEK